MGNVVRGELFCPKGQRNLAQQFEQNKVIFNSQTDDANESGRSSLSCGVVPITRVSREEELPSGQAEEFRLCHKIEREKDKQQDSYISEESGTTTMASYTLNDYILYPERMEGDTWTEASIQNEEVVKEGLKVTITGSTSCSTSKPDCDGEVSDWKDTKLRKRGNAIEVKPIHRPIGNFLPGKQFYLQNGDLEWEAVTIESWNFWNGTWQVRGEDGMDFPAKPNALKSKEEYTFFTRERRFSFRSFTSGSEISTN